MRPLSPGDYETIDDEDDEDDEDTDISPYELAGKLGLSEAPKKRRTVRKRRTSPSSESELVNRLLQENKALTDKLNKRSKRKKQPKKPSKKKPNKKPKKKAKTKKRTFLGFKIPKK